MMEQILIEESKTFIDRNGAGQMIDSGFTLGAFNRWNHDFVNAQNDSQVTTAQAGHLLYVRGKGIKKIHEATCSLCLTQGLNVPGFHFVGEPA